MLGGVADGGLAAPGVLDLSARLAVDGDDVVVVAESVRWGLPRERDDGPSLPDPTRLIQRFAP